MARTITSANAVLLLAIGTVFPVPVRIQGFASDDAFTQDAVDLAETMMGVDGKLSGGYTPNPIKQTIALQADSPSIDVFEAWIAAMTASREIFIANGTITLPSVKRLYTFSKGVLTSGKVLPDAKKALQSRSFVITWESVIAAPVL